MVRRALGALSVIVSLGSCVSTLGAGQLGVLRYAGRVRGATPLRLLPPVADSTGNVYALYGAPDYLLTQAFVGHVGGGWSSGCTLTKGDQFGAHGWAGFDVTREWYWSGDALVAVSGTDGTCHAVLDHDPSTNANLLFRGVLPWVRNLSERTTLVALVQSPTDSAPFSGLVDLNTEILTDVVPFDPPDAQDVTVLGVGGDRDQQVGVALVQYLSNGAGHLEARYFDGDANLTGRVTLNGGPFAAYAVQGYLEFAANGVVAGLLATGDAVGSMVLVTLSGGAGGISPISGMDPVGVHKWQGSLWLAGTANNGPVVAPITAQGVGSVVPWSASIATASALGGVITVRDDRSLPSRLTGWTDVRTAIGPFPFLGAHSLASQAPGTTLWDFAGPADQDGSGNVFTSFAMAPVGVSYP
jgi:hypothetical protein